MGDSETGGDGSVQWEVKVDKVRKKAGVSDVESIDVGLGHKQKGIDNDGLPGTKMTVSIEAPLGTNAQAFRTFLQGSGLQIDGNRVYFNIKIEPNNPHQVRLSWGDLGQVRDGPTWDEAAPQPGPAAPRTAS